MPRVKLTLAYKGTRFAGWQAQEPEGAAPLRTVQGCLEEAVARILGGPVRIHGAGRTDAGVHALGQVAHLDLPDRDLNWQAALNHHLPRDVTVRAVETVAHDFHARFDARHKTYAYALWLERGYLLPQRRHYVWAVGPLDLAAMAAAARQLLGKHDFAAFQNQGSRVQSTVRHMLGIEFAACPHFPELVLRFTATGFLKQMVRNLTGCLVAVGRGRLQPDALPSLLAGRKRAAAPATAPAWGLTLESIQY